LGFPDKRISLIGLIGSIGSSKLTNSTNETNKTNQTIIRTPTPLKVEHLNKMADA